MWVVVGLGLWAVCAAAEWWRQVREYLGDPALRWTAADDAALEAWLEALA